jgi:hypothetical protein
MLQYTPKSWQVANPCSHIIVVAIFFTSIVHPETLDFNLQIDPLLDQFKCWFTHSIISLEK